MLTSRLLSPSIYNVPNPLASIVRRMEDGLAAHPLYLEQEWPKVKRGFIHRVLGLSKTGSMLRGCSVRAPNDEAASAILDVYALLDKSVYFTSRYWRAFYHWLNHGALGAHWPQFGQPELDLALAVLDHQEIDSLKAEARKDWQDFHTQAEMDALFKRIKKPLRSLCTERVAFLAGCDASIYSADDVMQHACEEILARLRQKDYRPCSEGRMDGWVMKCADNALHNLRDKALAKMRSPLVGSKYRMSSFSHGGQDGESDESFTQEEEGVQAVADLDDFIQVRELMDKADPKIRTYLKTICCGEHNPEFWTWFYYNEPALSKREAYVTENPEAIGPYLQRHLNLSTHHLTRFLKENLPEILEGSKREKSRARERTTA
jgi:DNA-directed RNA polymerase specialized sigma24 family protein